MSIWDYMHSARQDDGMEKALVEMEFAGTEDY